MPSFRDLGEQLQPRPGRARHAPRARTSCSAAAGGPDVATRQLAQPGEKLERPRDQLGLRLLLRLVDEAVTSPVWKLLPLVSSAAGTARALDDDVQSPVLEAASTSATRRACPPPDPVVVRVHEPELEILVEALADELLVALLEHVQRHELGRSRTSGSGKRPSRSHCALQDDVLPDARSPRLDETQAAGLSRCDDRATRVDERSERPPERRCTAFWTATAARSRAGRGEAHERARVSRPPARELDAVGRAADDPVQEDRVGGLDRMRILEEVRDGERRPAREAAAAASRARPERGDELHDLALVGPCQEQLGLELPDAAPDLEDAGTFEPLPRRRGDQLALDSTRPFAW